jgi:hypothetical protein
METRARSTRAYAQHYLFQYFEFAFKAYSIENQLQAKNINLKFLTKKTFLISL